VDKLLYTCKTKDCKTVTEAPDIDTILSREKLCKKCFLNKYYKYHLINETKDTEPGTKPREKLYKYMCYECGSVTLPLANKPSYCKKCRNLAMFKTDLIQD
jgi:hypothetical protein